LLDLKIKRCSTCKEEKSCSEFGKNRAMKDGLQRVCKACRSIHYKNNALQRHEYMKEYYKKNKNELLKKNKEHRDENKARLDDDINPPKIINCINCKEDKDKDEFHICKTFKNGRHKICKSCKSEYDKKYRIENSDRIRERNKVRNRKRSQNDVYYRLTKNFRTRQRLAIKGNFKAGSAVRDLGCSISECKLYLEDQFYLHSVTGEEMTWDNWGSGLGKWQIHHIIPLESFDLTNREQFLVAFHYTNLQPLWHEDHVEKHKSWENE